MSGTRPPSSGCSATARSPLTGASRPSLRPRTAVRRAAEDAARHGGLPLAIDRCRDHLLGRAPAVFGLQRFFKAHTGGPALVVGPGIKTGMPILYENPREVGADRIVNAVAAYDELKAGCIVVDFGTATTWDVVTPKGEYLGGVIAPGLQISSEALYEHAAKLPRVELARPGKVVGRNTVASMQAGPRVRLRRHGRRAGLADPRRGRLPGALRGDRGPGAADRDRDQDDRGHRRAAHAQGPAHPLSAQRPRPRPRPRPRHDRARWPRAHAARSGAALGRRPARARPRPRPAHGRARDPAAVDRRSGGGALPALARRRRGARAGGAARRRPRSPTSSWSARSPIPPSIRA